MQSNSTIQMHIGLTHLLLPCLPTELYSYCFWSPVLANAPNYCPALLKSSAETLTMCACLCVGVLQWWTCFGECVEILYGLAVKKKNLARKFWKENSRPDSYLYCFLHPLSSLSQQQKQTDLQFSCQEVPMHVGTHACTHTHTLTTLLTKPWATSVTISTLSGWHCWDEAAKLPWRGAKCREVWRWYSGGL